MRIADLKTENQAKTRSFFRFTLIELVLAMAIFAVLLVIIARFYNSAYKATSRMNEQSNTFENAKIALDLITRDIQCIFYENSQTPFWHWRPPDPINPPAGWGQYRNELLAFVSATNMLPNNSCTSKLCEVKYQKYYATSHSDSNSGWLRRSATGNKLSDGTDNLKWNYYNNLVIGYTTATTTVIDEVTLEELEVPVAAFTANSASSDSYQKVIPYVVDLSFTCFGFDENGNEITITPDQTISTAADSGTMTGFPFSIEISLTLMDKSSWQKWIAVGGNANPKDDADSVETFRKSRERTFTKTVLIGNRGQYD